MAVRAVFEADTPEELQKLLRQVLGPLVLEQKPQQESGERAERAGVPVSSAGAPEVWSTPLRYHQFKNGRSEMAQKILDTMERRAGPICLRDLEKAVDRSGSQMAGTLGALEHAASGAFGAKILLAGVNHHQH